MIVPEWRIVPAAHSALSIYAGRAGLRHASLPIASRSITVCRLHVAAAIRKSPAIRDLLTKRPPVALHFTPNGRRRYQNDVRRMDRHLERRPKTVRVDKDRRS